MVKIVYWSGTGNTEAMAEAVAEGAKSAGAEVEVIPVAAADESVLAADVVLFGCPAMGNEELEEGSSSHSFPRWRASFRGRR